MNKFSHEITIPLLLPEETPKQIVARWRATGKLRTLPRTSSDPFFFHRRIKVALERVGFLVRSIKREDYHPLWIVRLRRRTNHEEVVVPGVKVHFVTIFQRFGCPLSRADFDVHTHGSSRLMVAFLWERGTPGTLSS